MKTNRLSVPSLSPHAQRLQKQRQLLLRLQDLLLGPKADEQTTCEVMDYFMRRLSSPQVASRVLAMKVSQQRSRGSPSMQFCVLKQCLKWMEFFTFHQRFHSLKTPRDPQVKYHLFLSPFYSLYYIA